MSRLCGERGNEDGETTDGARMDAYVDLRLG